jgi:hypothetical protein
MTLTRRTMLKSALIAAVAATEAGRAIASGSRAAPIAWRVFDSRLPLSRAWLGPGAEGTIDVAEEQASRWARLRGMIPGGRVAGMTTWSDFVQVRGLLQEKGMRLRREARSGDLFCWEMV